MKKIILVVLLLVSTVALTEDQSLRRLQEAHNKISLVKQELNNTILYIERAKEYGVPLRNLTTHYEKTNVRIPLRLQRASEIITKAQTFHDTQDFDTSYLYSTDVILEMDHSLEELGSINKELNRILNQKDIEHQELIEQAINCLEQLDFEINKTGFWVSQFESVNAITGTTITELEEKSSKIRMGIQTAESMSGLIKEQQANTVDTECKTLNMTVVGFNKELKQKAFNNIQTKQKEIDEKFENFPLILTRFIHIENYENLKQGITLEGTLNDSSDYTKLMQIANKTFVLEQSIPKITSEVYNRTGLILTILLLVAGSYLGISSLQEATLRKKIAEEVKKHKKNKVKK